MSDPLLELCKLRELEIDVDGNKVKVREFSALEYAEFSTLREDNRIKGMAYLMRTCVLAEDGSPRWTEDESMQVASGSMRLAARLVNSILRLGGLGEKND